MCRKLINPRFLGAVRGVFLNFNAERPEGESLPTCELKVAREQCAVGLGDLGTDDR